MPDYLLHYFMGHALSNPTLCTGTVPEWQIAVWFNGRGGITREQIAARQALEFAKEALKLAERQ